MSGPEQHGISRVEWVRRFKASMAAQAGLMDTPAVERLLEAELASWPEVDEVPEAASGLKWRDELPETAASESLSAWTA